jgi:hypothetical protein
MTAAYFLEGTLLILFVSNALDIVKPIKYAT